MGDDPDVHAYLSGRGIPVDRVELGDLARALPPRPPLTWHFSSGRKPWTVTGHKLVCPAWTASGELAGLHARAVGDSLQKTLWPCRTAVRGLVFANDVGQLLLTGSVPAWWSRELIIVEGLTDYLAAAVQASDSDTDAPAVLGVVAGSWCAELAARVPDHTRVLIATDRDAAGEAYAHAIATTLPNRCSVYRWGTV